MSEQVLTITIEKSPERRTFRLAKSYRRGLPFNLSHNSIILFRTVWNPMFLF